MSGTGIDVPNLPKCPVPELMLYRTYRSVRYRNWCCTELTEVSGTGIDAIPDWRKSLVPVRKSVPVPAVPVSISYRTYQSVRIHIVSNLPKCPNPYRIELTKVSDTGMDVPNVPKYPVPVLMSYRTYRSVRYRHRCTELTEVFGTDIDAVTNLPKGTGIYVVPNIPKCPIPVLPAVYVPSIPGIPR